jgi:hypothetical protein
MLTVNRRVPAVAALATAIALSPVSFSFARAGTQKDRPPIYYQMIRSGFSVTLWVRKREIIRTAVRATERCHSGYVSPAALELAKSGDYVRIKRNGRFAFVWRRLNSETVFSGQIDGRGATGIYRDWESDPNEGGPCGTGQPGDRTLHFNAPRVKHIRKPPGLEPFN